MEVRVWFSCPGCGAPEATNFEDVNCPGCCKECKRLESDMMAALMRNEHLDMKPLRNHIDTFHKRISKSHVGNGAPQGQFAFTLTCSPSHNLSKDDMVKAVKKLMAQKSCPVKYYAWYLEYGDMEECTHWHIHGMYETETGGRIERKHFKRAWPIWGEGDETKRLGLGFVGGYHRPVRDKEAYADYIKKYDLEHESVLPPS